jgi:hypothetical protein
LKSLERNQALSIDWFSMSAALDSNRKFERKQSDERGDQRHTLVEQRRFLTGV